MRSEQRKRHGTIKVGKIRKAGRERDIYRQGGKERLSKIEGACDGLRMNKEWFYWNMRQLLNGGKVGKLVNEENPRTDFGDGVPSEHHKLTGRK